MPALSVCPDAAALRRLLIGEAPDNEAEQLERHLLGCSRCVEIMRAVQADSKLLEALRKVPNGEGVPQDGAIEELVRRMRELTVVATISPAAAPTLAPDAAPPAKNTAGLAP